MKERLKDPRPLLSLLPKLFFITFIWIPLVYINLKESHIFLVILLIFLYVIVLILIKKFNRKKEEYKLHSAILIGYVFSGLIVFIASLSIFAIIVDYSRQILPKQTSIFITVILLFFSLILFYLAHKSKKYEKLRETSKS